MLRGPASPQSPSKDFDTVRPTSSTGLKPSISPPTIYRHSSLNTARHTTTKASYSLTMGVLDIVPVSENNRLGNAYTLDVVAELTVR